MYCLSSVRFLHSVTRKDLISKILRVDHIGELAAVRIYDGQQAVFKGMWCFLVKTYESQKNSQLKGFLFISNQVPIRMSVFQRIPYICLLAIEILILCTEEFTRSTVKKMRDEELKHLYEMERLCTTHNTQPSIFAPVMSIVAYALGLCRNFSKNVGLCALRCFIN